MTRCLGRRSRAHESFPLRLWLSVLVACGIVGGACQAQGDAPLAAADEQAIREGVESWLMAANSGDIAAWAEVYAEDAVVMPPNMPPLDGRAAVADLLASLPPISDWTIDVRELDGRGDLAYLRGAYSFRMTLPGIEAPIADNGSLMHIWRKQADGSWRVQREIYHSDNPLPMPQ